MKTKIAIGMLCLGMIECSSGQIKSSIPPEKTIGYTGVRWQAEASRLTKDERNELVNLTSDNLHCSNSTWDNENLRWFCDSTPKTLGSRAILPMSMARSEAKRRAEDAEWCDPNMFAFMITNVHQYRCVSNPNGPPGRKGRMEIDQAAEEELNKIELHRSELAQAFTTRVLTPNEMKEVLAYGPDIFVATGTNYYQADVDAKFQFVLQTQILLRQLAATEKGSK